MGQVRNAVRAYALLDARPGLVLQRTNALLRALPELQLTTMIFGVYDPATCQLTFSRAGHPPPLHRHHGTVTVFDQPNGPLLGAVADLGRYAEATVNLVPGDTLLWYTDGLIERRGGDILVAEEQLRDLLASPVAAGADDVVSLVDHTLIAGHHLDDDACLLVVHLPPAGVSTTPPAGSDIHHAVA
jgi:serine phosphatase RsbU (regulator of sigma subunit)